MNTAFMEITWENFTDLGPIPKAQRRRRKFRCLKCGKFCAEWWDPDSPAILSLCCFAPTEKL